MQDGFDVPGSAGRDPAKLLDFERLDVYRVALEFQALASSITLPQGRRELRDQLERAALSIVLNTAEGAGRVGAADKARFFAMARGSAMECAAVIDVLRATGVAPHAVCGRGRSSDRLAAFPGRPCRRLVPGMGLRCRRRGSIDRTPELNRGARLHLHPGLGSDARLWRLRHRPDPPRRPSR